MKVKVFNQLLKHYGTQRKMAKAAGVTEPAIVGWKSGEYKPSAKSAIKLSRDCGIEAHLICEDLK